MNIKKLSEEQELLLATMSQTAPMQADERMVPTLVLTDEMMDAAGLKQGMPRQIAHQWNSLEEMKQDQPEMFE